MFKVLEMFLYSRILGNTLGNMMAWDIVENQSDINQIRILNDIPICIDEFSFNNIILKISQLSKYCQFFFLIIYFFCMQKMSLKFYMDLSCFSKINICVIIALKKISMETFLLNTITTSFFIVGSTNTHFPIMFKFNLVKYKR